MFAASASNLLKILPTATFPSAGYCCCGCGCGEPKLAAASHHRSCCAVRTHTDSRGRGCRARRRGLLAGGLLRRRHDGRRRGNAAPEIIPGALLGQTAFERGFVSLLYQDRFKPEWRRDNEMTRRKRLVGCWKREKQTKSTKLNTHNEHTHVVSLTRNVERGLCASSSLRAYGEGQHVCNRPYGTDFSQVGVNADVGRIFYKTHIPIQTGARLVTQRCSFTGESESSSNAYIFTRTAG